MRISKKIISVSIFAVSLIVLSGCASNGSKKIPNISTVALLSQDSDLYIGIPVKYHKDLVKGLISSQTGLSENSASTVAGRIANLYIGLGSRSDSKRTEISADGSFPSFAIDMALDKKNGWVKKDYTAVSNPEALALGYPNKFKYFSNPKILYKVSFPTDKYLMLSKKIEPLMENFAARYDSDLLSYGNINLSNSSTKDILIYSPNPSMLASTIIGDMASNWFTLAEGRLIKLSGGDYNLSCNLSLADNNRKTIVMALLTIAGIPVEEVDSTTIYVSNVKVTRELINRLVSGKK